MSRLSVLACVSLCLALARYAPAQPAGTYLQKTRTIHSPEEFARVTGGRVRLERGVDRQAYEALRKPGVKWPTDGVTVVHVESPSVTWVGTTRGAIRFTDGARTCEYFAGPRWLPDDRVEAIGSEGRATWLQTPKGLSRIDYVPMKLADKSRAFVERVQARHNRWGLVAESHLRVAGDLSTSRTVSNDNDGLWTAVYVAAECFRYKVTGEFDARDNARRGMAAILRLESITGIPGFPARSFIKVGEDLQPGDGEWHDAAEKGWRWKGDTSSDEIVGHYFVYPIYFDLAADDSEKAALRAAIGRITSRIVDNGYKLPDVDGKPTRWGWWDPETIWREADETGLRALHLLSHLRVAIHLADGDAQRAKFRAAYDELVRTHRYHLLTRIQKVAVPGLINHSDDQLAFLSYYPLLRYETDPQLLAVYRESLERSWRIERPERNPLWDFIYAAGTGSMEYDRAESLRTLREMPIDQVEWPMRNAHRLDVTLDPVADRHGRRQSLIVLPYDEIGVHKWNGNPYDLDGGGGGHSEGDGAYFLLPYWMGRYHKLIEE